MAELLSVKNLKTYFYRPDGVVKAVDGVSYTLDEGETLGIVGESGSGKSVSVLSLLRLLRGNGKIEDGQAMFMGKDLIKMSKEDLRQVRGKDIAMIFQNPMTSLNPTFKIGMQMMEPLVWHQLMNKIKSAARAIGLLEHVGIPEPSTRFTDYAFQFSGGMRQRVMIAMGLTCSPKLLIADEPTTALDVTVRSQILNLLMDMKNEFKMSVIVITHDFGVASNFCDKLIVMYAGKIVESAPIKEFINNPLHPYTLGLLRSTLDLDVRESELKPIPGNPPNLIHLPAGCSFYPRCDRHIDICKTVEPELLEKVRGHLTSCHVVNGRK